MMQVGDGAHTTTRTLGLEWLHNVHAELTQKSNILCTLCTYVPQYWQNNTDNMFRKFFMWFIISEWCLSVFSRLFDLTSGKLLILVMICELLGNSFEKLWIRIGIKEILSKDQFGLLLNYWESALHSHVVITCLQMTSPFSFFFFSLTKCFPTGCYVTWN